MAVAYSDQVCQASLQCIIAGFAMVSARISSILFVAWRLLDLH